MSERDSNEIVIDGDSGESIEFSVLTSGTVCIGINFPYASAQDSGVGITTSITLTREDVDRLIAWMCDKGY